MQFLLDWFLVHYLEIIGTLSGFLYIYFSIQQKIWLWPVGLFSSICQLIVFFNSKIYADMSLQAYYIIISLYGWYHWSKGKMNKANLPVIRMKYKEWGVFLVSNIIIFIIIRFVLISYTDSDISNIDSFTTALSITGTVLLARKYIDNWYIWIVVDFVSSGLYIYKEKYFFALLYGVLAVLSIIGYKNWRKDMTD